MPLQVPVTQTGLEASIQQAMKNAGRNAQINLGTNSRQINALKQPLGRITGQADEFTKSMEAANARVFAFGASVGIINGVTKAFGALVRNTIEVEKSLVEINIVLNASSDSLQQFGNKLFDVAKTTGQTFDVVAKGALELARQGLSTEETLKRINDALILSRLSGLDAQQSVEGLTAAFNSFKETGITTSQILNKLVVVSQKYSVSERDLIEGLKRSASVADQAGVSFDELVGIITTVQERTARGGAVIGNAFKTIFARIQDRGALEDLASFGIEITDLQGKILPATQILQNLAGEFNKLSQVEQADLAKKLGGVYQLSNLLAAVKDLSSKQSKYVDIVKLSAGATDEAYKKNAALNETLATLINKVNLSAQQLGATLGAIGVTDGLKKVLDFFNNILEGIQKILGEESMLGDMFRGLAKGVGNVLAGPGLALFGAIIAKLSKDLIQFGVSSLKSFFQIGQSAKEIQNVEKAIAAALGSNLSLQRQLFALEGNRAAQIKLMTDAIVQQEAAMRRMTSTAGSLAAPLYQQGVRSTGGQGLRVPKAAGGYMPAVAGEASDIRRGVGGARSSDKPVVIPNFAFGGGRKGTMVAHTGEYIVPNFAAGGSAIFNRDMVRSMGLPSGAKKIGAAGGFIPNFAKLKELPQQGYRDFNWSSFEEASKAAKDGLVTYNNSQYRISKSQFDRALVVTNKQKKVIDVASVLGGSLPTILTPSGSSGLSESIKKINPLNNGLDYNFQFKKFGLQANGKQSIKQDFERRFNDETIKNLANKTALSYARKIVSSLDSQNPIEPETLEKVDQVKGFISSVKGAFGGIFDAAVTTGVKAASRDNGRKAITKGIGDFDVNARGESLENIKKLFGENSVSKNGLADFKINAGKEAVDSMTKKVLSSTIFANRLKNAGVAEAINKASNQVAVNKAEGYIPNFAKYIYDSDRILPDKGATLKEILASKIKKNLIIGPAGSGKSTFAGRSGKFISGISDLASATEIDILSGAARTKSGGVSKNLEALITAVNTSGGKVSYLYAKNLDILSRRAGRINPDSGDLRSKKQLAGTTYAPLNQFDFMKYVKSKSSNFSLINGAAGFIPNFADPLKEAIGREMSAGVPASQIYVDKNSSLKNSMNPMGLMVANRRDEPTGGIQGINRARKEGANPMLYGAARGFIPNYAPPIGEVTRQDLGRTKISDQSIQDFNKSLNEISTNLRKGSISFADAINKVSQLSSSTGSTTAQVTRLRTAGEGLVTAYNNELQARNARAQELKKERSEKRSSSSSSGTPRDLLGTIFLVQTGLSLLTGATSDATSGIGKLANAVGSVASAASTVALFGQGLSGLAKEGGTASKVLGQIGIYGAIAAGVFEGFKQLGAYLDSTNPAINKASEAMYRVSEAASKAAVNLSTLNPAQKEKIQQSREALISGATRIKTPSTDTLESIANYLQGIDEERVVDFEGVSDKLKTGFDETIDQALAVGVSYTTMWNMIQEASKSGSKVTADEIEKISQEIINLTNVAAKFKSEDLISKLNLKPEEGIGATLAGLNEQDLNSFVTGTGRRGRQRVRGDTDPLLEIRKQFTDLLSAEGVTGKIAQEERIRKAVELIKEKGSVEKQEIETAAEASLKAFNQTIKQLQVQASIRKRLFSEQSASLEAEYNNNLEISRINSDITLSETERTKALKDQEVRHGEIITNLQKEKTLSSQIDEISKSIGEKAINPEKQAESIKKISEFLKEFKDSAEFKDIVLKVSLGEIDAEQFKSQIEAKISGFGLEASQITDLLTGIKNLAEQSGILTENAQQENYWKGRNAELDKSSLDSAKQKAEYFEKINLFAENQVAVLERQSVIAQGKTQALDINKQIELTQLEKFGGVTKQEELFAKQQAIEEKYFNLRLKADEAEARRQLDIETKRSLYTKDNIEALMQNKDSINQVKTSIDEAVSAINKMPEDLSNVVTALSGQPSTPSPLSNVLLSGGIGMQPAVGKGNVPLINIPYNGIPAPNRFNNPGGAYPSDKFIPYGLQAKGIIGGGHPIGYYPNIESGISANMAHFRQMNPTGKTVGEMRNYWVTGKRGGFMDLPGMNSNQMISPDLLNDPNWMGQWMKATAQAEGFKGGLSNQQLMSGFNMYQQKGGINNIPIETNIQTAFESLSKFEPEIIAAGDKLSEFSGSTELSAKAMEEAAKITSDLSLQNKIAAEIQNRANGVNKIALKSQSEKDIFNLQEQLKVLEQAPNTFSDGMKKAFLEMDKENKNFAYEMGQQIPKMFSDGISGAIMSAVEGTTSLKDGLRNAAYEFIKTLNQRMISNLVDKSISALGNFGMSFFSDGGAVPKYASGGMINGGSGSKDDVPAMLMGGEYVINKKSVQKYGPEFLHAINNGKLGGYAKGGKVENLPIQNTSQGDFYTPGTYGQGGIQGRQNLLDFATQSYTSGKYDEIKTGENYASINLEGESVRLTNWGRMNNPQAQAIREAKEQAFDLYMQDVEAEKQRKEQQKQLDEQNKAMKKQMLMQIGMAVAGAAAGAGASGFKAAYGASKAAGGTFSTNLLAGAKGIFTGAATTGGVNVGGLNNWFTGIGKGLTGNFSDAANYFKLSNMSSIDQLGQAYSMGVGYDGKMSSLNKFLDKSGYIPRAFPVQPTEPSMGSNGILNWFKPQSRRATGGSIPSTSGIDTVPTMLSGGEFIMNRAASQNIGAGNLQALNAGAGSLPTEEKTEELNDKLIAKLDELIVAMTEGGSSGSVTINVDSNGKSTQETTGESSESREKLAKQIKDTVMKVIEQEKRLGGKLRRGL